MIIADRLRLVRQRQKLSRGDIEARTGLSESHISNLENGRTVPDLETLEKLAGALRVPLHAFFYDGEAPPKLPNLPGRVTTDDIAGVRTSDRPKKKHAEAGSKSDNQPGGGSARR
jgi:transcriptional regulator with XRE-family HTH domain